MSLFQRDPMTGRTFFHGEENFYDAGVEADPNVSNTPRRETEKKGEELPGLWQTHFAGKCKLCGAGMEEMKQHFHAESDQEVCTSCGKKKLKGRACLSCGC